MGEFEAAIKQLKEEGYSIEEIYGAINRLKQAARENSVAMTDTEMFIKSIFENEEF
ncbi:hypothetical protein NSQ62_08470 [Solibacillus sp. FSL H8-0523]|uniref:hypothetical protein n=1 Tax=Solibacillus sp. FSL H8-0523 TaxID=2954511 RepID=UPI003101189A